MPIAGSPNLPVRAWKVEESISASDMWIERTLTPSTPARAYASARFPLFSLGKVFGLFLSTPALAVRQFSVGDALVNVQVPSTDLVDELAGQLWRRWDWQPRLPGRVEFGPVARGLEPVPYRLLVVALLRLPRSVRTRRPHPELVRPDGVCHQDFALRVLPELQLQVGEDEARALGFLRHLLEDEDGRGFDLVKFRPGHEALLEDPRLRHRLVVHLRLGRGVEEGRGQLRGEDLRHVERDLAPVHPLEEAAVQVAPNDALDHDHLDLLHDHHVGALEPDHVVRYAERLEPISPHLAQRLSLVRDGRGQDHVEGGDAVCEVEEQVLRVEVVDVLHLSRAEEPARRPLGLAAHPHAFLIVSIRSFTMVSPMAIISAARMPAFLALSIPTHATGTPGGIWTIERSESSPFSFALTGTPITGFTVVEAITPGRCAARPATAMKTSALEPARYLCRPSGLRWAERNWTSCDTPSSVSAFTASSTTCWSLLLPAIIATRTRSGIFLATCSVFLCF